MNYIRIFNQTTTIKICSRFLYQKKNITFIAFLLLSFLILSSSGSAIARTALHSAAEPDYFPLSFKNSQGQADGLAVELLHAATRAMEQDINFNVRPWNEIKQELANNQLDVLPLVGRTPEREKQFDFTVPYLSLYGAIVVRKDDNHIYNNYDLRHHRVGVMTGDVADEYMRREDFTQSLVTTQNYTEALRLLSNGQIDAVVVQQLVAQQLIKKLGLDNIEIRSKITDFRQDFCFAVTEGDKELLAMLNEGLSRIVTNGTFSQLREKWLGSFNLDKFKFSPPQYHLTDTEIQWIKKHPEVSLAGKTNQLPYGTFDENGTYIGVIADHLKLIEKKTGLKFKPVPISNWNELQTITAEGKTSVIPSDSTDTLLSQNFNSVKSYKQDPIVIIMSSEQNYVEHLREIKDQKIAIIKDHNFSSDDILFQYPDFKFIEVKNIQQGLEGVSQGRFDALLSTIALASYHIADMELHNIKVVGKTSIVIDQTLFISKNQPILHSIIDKTLKAISQDETQSIMQSWIKNRYVEKTDYTIVIMVGSGLLLILAIILIWNRRLHQEIVIRYETEEALKKSEERYRSLIDTSPDWVWEVNANGVYTYASPKVYELLGYRPDEVIGATPFDLMTEADASRVATSFAEIVTNKRPFQNLMNTNLHKNGDIVVLETSGVPILSKEGELLGYRGVDRDITQRQSNEQELRVQRDFTNTIIESAGNTIAVLDLNGRFVHFNHAAEKLTGFKKEDIIGKTAWETVIPEKQQSGVKNVFQNLRKGKTDIAGEYENEWLTSDGGRRLLHWHNSVLYDQAGKVSHIVAMGYDITEAKSAEKEHQRIQNELQQAQKMESLGLLTGGIAHDFNNLLGIINGFAQLTLDQYVNNNEEKPAEYIRHILQAGDRSARLIAQMLAFTRKDSTENIPLNLAPQLEEDIKMLRSTLPSTIKIKTEIEAELPPILINPSQLHQILMNLAINARDAMNDIGELGIKLNWVRNLDTRSSISHKPVKGDWIELCISDTGSGINEDIINNIFNPFFTTKEVGKGSGMGLAVVYRIIENLGGHILLDTKKDKGTNLCILFAPLLEKNSQFSDSEQEHSSTTKGNGSEILVVDDEVILAEYMSKLLEMNNYKPYSMTDSTKTLELFKQDPDRFSMLITDQTMPEMMGTELIMKLREIRPDLPVIMCSGYSNKINADEAIKLNIHYLSKPVDPNKLLLKMNELLK